MFPVTLLMGAVVSAGECFALVLDDQHYSTGGANCGDNVDWSIFEGVFNALGQPRAEYSALGAYAPLETDEPSSALLASLLGVSDEGGLVIQVWDDGVSTDECQEACDGRSLEAMLRRCVITNGGVRKLRVVQCQDQGVPLECGTAPLETLLRGCIVEVAPEEYAIRYLQA